MTIHRLSRPPCHQAGTVDDNFRSHAILTAFDEEKMKIRTIAVVYIFIGWLLVFPLNPLGAQPNAITLTKGRVMAVLDTLSGRFGTMRADGKTLLFASGTG